MARKKVVLAEPPEGNQVKQSNWICAQCCWDTSFSPMRAVLGLLLLVWFAAGAASCMHNRVVISTLPGAQPEKRVAHFFFVGLMPRKRVYSDSEFCGQRGIKQIHVYSSWWNFLASWASILIWTPRTVEVTCRAVKPDQTGAPKP